MDTELDTRRPWHLLGAAVLSVLLLTALFAAGAEHFTTKQWADFGNFVGGTAGVLLTALTFLALLFTIHIQSKELSLSREELRLTREEMRQNREELARSAEALDAQVAGIKSQNFERSLFESLGFLNNVVSQLEFRSPMEDRARNGAQAFLSMYQLLASHEVGLGALGTQTADEIGGYPPLNQVMERLRPQVATYFRTLYNIYRYLDESEFRSNVYYNRIIRSQISDYAMALLF